MMFPWKLKHIQNLCFDINFHFSWWPPLSVVKHFSFKKLSQRILFFTRARNRGEYGVTTVSGRIPTKWCSHLSERKFSFFVPFHSLKKIFGKLTQSLTTCSCFMILWPEQQIVLSFPFCLPKAGIEMLVWYCCYKICFQRENLTRTLAGMLSTWLSSEVLAIENKSVSLRNECLTKPPAIHVSLFSRNGMAFVYIFVDNRPDSPSDKQILSDIFGSCLRYPTIKFHRTRMEIIGLWK